MWDWMKKKVPFLGGVLFRGEMGPRMEEFGYLEEQGIRLSPGPQKPDLRWSLTLEHPDWGEAVLKSARDRQPPIQGLVEQTFTITEKERQVVLEAGSTLELVMTGTKNHLLRDRKCALRFLQAVMADDGLAGIDYLAQAIWTRGALEEELSHDGDLDISQIMAFHAVSGEPEEREAEEDEEEEEEMDITWLHSHGLGEIGFFDYDILQPSEALMGTGVDVLRALSYAIIENRVSISTGRFGVCDRGGAVRFVDVKDFNQLAAPEYAGLRDRELEFHNERRSVLCEPEGKLLGRWSKKVKPSKFLSGEFDERTLIHFSAEASDLMAQRAQSTYSQLRALSEEFKEFEFPVGVKIGYPVDDGGEDDKEHLWYEVHGFYDEEIDGTLESPPMAIARFTQGERGRHPVRLMSDWLISTPAGMINPRDSLPARRIRENWDKLRELMRAMKEMEEE